MSETGTESTGFPPETPAAAGPRTYTTDELAAARALLEEAGELDPAGQAPASPDDLASQIHAAGAEAADPDVAKLMQQIQAMQAQMDKLSQAARAQNVPDAVKYADALAGHVAAKLSAHPSLADTLKPLSDLAGAAQGAAAAAAEQGHPGQLEDAAAKVAAWVAKEGRRLPHLDLAYIAELAEEAAGAAVKIAA